MELFSVNVLLVLFYTLMMTSPAISTTGSSALAPSTDILGIRIPRYGHPGFHLRLPYQHPTVSPVPFYH